MIAKVFAGGSTYERDGLLVLDRHGFLEECYFDYAYSPVRDERGAVGGIWVACSETTGRVLGERRLKVLGRIAANASDESTVEGAARAALAALSESPADVPCAAIYLARRDRAVLTASYGFPSGSEWLAPELPIGAACAEEPWPIGRALRDGTKLRVHAKPGGPALPGGPWPDPGKSATVMPLSHGGRVLGALVAGLSPRLPYDEQYRNFLDLVADHVARALSGAIALDEERRRAEALAELDRAKTAFFSNVSHEFRTPLTLSLGPVEEALSSPERMLSGAALETVHRNQLRLLRLVNGLLEFARIEAGRVQANLEPTDLAALTADLASAFRSAFQRAGVRLVTDIPPALVTRVDPDMWEKIVLNLLSNALKYTFEGEVRVVLREGSERVALEVRDTGVGIPPDSLERVFERFHRIEGTRARTQEGSGIGLALVAELTRLHGGSVRAESTLGGGSVFTVELPAERGSERGESSSARRPQHAASYVGEALRWAAPEPEEPATPSRPEEDARILVADDNADMREYLRRVLGVRWWVETAADGKAALASARARPPDVVVCDVMMPELDGFGVLRALREDAATRDVRVVMLSARAGEEAQVDGLRAGADDYVVKPFGARELVARVATQVELSRARRRLEGQRAELYRLFVQAPAPICVLRGSDLAFEVANPGYEALIGRSGIAGRPLLEVLPELRGQGLVETLHEVMRTGTAFVAHERPVQLARAPGMEPEPRWFTFLYAPLTTEGGAIERVMVFANDVSEQVRAREAVEAASRAKDEFLAMLGHELRNPLAPMTTSLQLMKIRAPQTFVREREVLERQVGHMTRLVDDLLDVSRITRGKVELRRRRVQVSDVVARALEVAEPMIAERSHAVEVDVAPGLVVDGDADRLVQIVSNLLTNAAKYMRERGRIRVRAVAEGPQVVVTVEDEGRGLEPALQPRVFDLFVQGQRTVRGARGGLGLGLAIVKNLTEMHGGSVAARSDGPGKGSTFEVRLPLAAADAQIAADTLPRARSSRRRRVLVVDDNRDAAESLVEVLRARGHDARAAFDGPGALAAAADLQPDVVLLDLGMPAMDGFEVARRLREQGHRAKLVALTGFGQRSDHERTRDAGFDSHEVKPVDLDRLAGVLDA
jgi:signal transduction histidine kinase